MADLTKANGAVDLIVTRINSVYKREASGLHTVTRSDKFNVSEIWRAGSLGHGTVVPGHYDIDLVLYSQDIKAEDVLKQNGFHLWTAHLKEFIKKEFGIESATPGYNHRSVQFQCSFQGVQLQVDLLVSPFWDSPREFYKFLRRVPRERRSMFTICGSKWQIEFFRNVDNKAKEYIRRAKAWRNKVWEANKSGRPSSYLMSLLVLRAYEKANRYYGAGDREVTRELVSLVANSHFLDVYWEGENYRLAEYSDLLPARPRVIDPANPANNVWESGIAGDASVLIRKISTIDLSIPI